MDNKFNKFLPFFSFFDEEFSLGRRHIDSFLYQFSFHVQKQDIRSHLCDLDNITISASIDLHSVIVISDTSIRNNIATCILYIHLHNRPIIKTIHHMVNITSTKAKLFTLRCEINQAINIPNIKHIVVVTDSLHVAKNFFDTSIHLYQIHSATISWELRDFFKKDSNNCIKFWNCSSKQKWTLHFLVDKDTRRFDFSLILPSKSSWDFCKKCKCDSISAMWRMNFQALDLKERNFLELLDNDSNPLELSTIKGRLWLQYFSHSNSLYTRTTRAIVNHAPIREYWLRFFPREEFAYPCGVYLIELRHHILHKYKRFNNYWNLRRDSIVYFSQFLIFNSKTFSFKDSIASLNC